MRLLVKYAIELKDDLQEGLAATPSQSWKNIIPQLFARLNHPESYIRQSISKLLCRIARDYSHLIIYQAVVGSQDGPTKIQTKIGAATAAENAVNDEARKSNSQSSSLAKPSEAVGKNLDKSDEEINSGDDLSNEEEDRENEEEDEEEEDNIEDQEGEEQDVNIDRRVGNENENEENEEEVEEEEEGTMLEEEKKLSELKSTYKCLLDTLSETNPKVIDEVKLFVHEMRRITLLREELWYGTLNQIHSDISKRIEQLNLELIKVNGNESLSETERVFITKAKYEILLHPIVALLENVHEITTSLNVCETPNEEQFQLDFGDKIHQALLRLKDTEANACKPANGWSLFKNLHHAFHQRSQRRQTTSLLMDQISPKLANLRHTSIPIPGKDGQQCTIHSIGNHVQVLPTKTKPKKLFFIGSNGKRYQYLFKGLEDLHLDERIMQLLSIINSMFAKLNKSECIQYNALNYSVTPLGPRSGLISWVEGATPLFTLYKKWQHREAIYIAYKQQQSQPQQQQPNTAAGAPPQQLHILRPNDLYYTKLNPLLKEKNISLKAFLDSRR